MKRLSPSLLSTCAIVLAGAVALAYPALAQAQPDSYDGKVVMAVFAHPDDEGTVGPVLTKYARQGAEVILVIATDGRLGTNDFSGLTAGDGLAAIRRDEMK